MKCLSCFAWLVLQSCLQTLVFSLLPPPGPTAPDPNPGESWAPTPEEAAIQDEVVGALEKVRRRA